MSEQYLFCSYRFINIVTQTTIMPHNLFSWATAQLIHNVGQSEFAKLPQQNTRLGTNCAILTMRKF